MSPRGSHGVRRMFVVVAKHVFVFISVHVIPTAETKSKGERCICRGDGRGVGCCGGGVVEGFQRVDNAWDWDL